MSNKEILSCENLSFSYGREPTIKDVSFTLTNAKFYGIVGPNGCGKTTLLDLLTGNRKQDKGSIKLYGKPLERYGKRELAQQLALVPQEYDTGFGFSVEELVLMGRHPHIPRFASPSQADWEAVDRAMEAIAIDDLRHRLASTLSGGQKQRTVVARALAQDTPFLLFDEATSSLDIKYTLQIFNLVKELVADEGRTVVAVMHNLNLAAAYCDEVIIMNSGRIEAFGKTDATLTPATIAKVFGVESQIFWDDYNQAQQISFQYGRRANA